MPQMTIEIDGDGAWPDLAGKDVIRTQETIKMVLLANGMASGLPSVAIRVELPDGRTVVAETSARIWCVAAKLIMQKFPHLLDGH